MSELINFLARKRIVAPTAGFNAGKLNKNLFDWQVPITHWNLQKGRSAIFANCGLGKTLMQLVWAWMVYRHTDQNVLILTPLAVAKQTKAEGVKFGIQVNVCRRSADIQPGINVLNYEMLEDFDVSGFTGIVLDESSILKNSTGKTRKLITDKFADTPFKLCCSATPAPNDYIELGTHAEFLGVMNAPEMLATFFVHDGGETQKWRLKHHAEEEFWRWVCSWAVMLRKPSDIGFSDKLFTLPAIKRHQITVASSVPKGRLLPVEVKTLNDRRVARKDSISLRVERAVYLANTVHKSEPFLVWCDLNAESEMLASLIPDAVQITGSDSFDFKTKAMEDFTNGKVRCIVSKPSICGYGMNWQHCAAMVFVGLSDSFEQVYQAEHRCWRYGQKRTVNSYMITSEAEGAVVHNQERKLKDFDNMSIRMIEYMKFEMQRELGVSRMNRVEYEPTQGMIIPGWLKEKA